MGLLGFRQKDTTFKLTGNNVTEVKDLLLLNDAQTLPLRVNRTITLKTYNAKYGKVKSNSQQLIQV